MGGGRDGLGLMVGEMRARLKQHLHYTGTIAFLSEAFIFNPTNVKFRLKDPNLVLGWDLYHG